MDTFELIIRMSRQGIRFKRHPGLKNKSLTQFKLMKRNKPQNNPTFIRSSTTITTKTLNINSSI